MVDYIEMMKSPGLYIALVALIITVMSQTIAQKISPDNEEKMLKIKLFLKSGGLILAIIGFALVAKKAFFS